MYFSKIEANFLKISFYGLVMILGIVGNSIVIVVLSISFKVPGLSANSIRYTF